MLVSKVWYFTTDHVNRKDHDMHRDGILNTREHRFAVELMVVGEGQALMVTGEEGQVQRVYVLKGLIVFTTSVNQNMVEETVGGDVFCYLGTLKPEGLRSRFITELNHTFEVCVVHVITAFYTPPMKKLKRVHNIA